MTKASHPLVQELTAEQERREEDFSARLCDAEIDATKAILATNPTSEGLLSVVDNARGFAEAVTTKVRDRRNPPVACKKGCKWCCYQTVPVTAAEVFRIAVFLASERTNSRAQLEENLRTLDRTTRGLSPDARNRLRLPCAFLRDSRCSIYPVRPLACAEFTSYDVEDCKRGYRIGFKPESVIHEKARMLVYNAVIAGVTIGLRAALPRADGTRLELTAALVCVVDAPKAAEQWLAGEPIFANARLTRDST